MSRKECTFLSPIWGLLTSFLLGYFYRITRLLWCCSVQNPLRLVSLTGYGNSLGNIFRTANVLSLKLFQNRHSRPKLNVNQLAGWVGEGCHHARLQDRSEVLCKRGQFPAHICVYIQGLLLQLHALQLHALQLQVRLTAGSHTPACCSLDATAPRLPRYFLQESPLSTLV